ncbi:MAG TPA: hypothetical protein VFW87_25340 [Pirellulales bacterium]|nr:hypothetical protein [Pirellulales bacterium]
MPDREPRPYQFRLITLFLLTALLAVPLGLMFGDPSLVLVSLVEGVLLLLILAWFLFIYGELNSDAPSQSQVAIATVMIVIALLVGGGLFWSTVRKPRPAAPASHDQPASHEQPANQLRRPVAP